MGSPIWTRSKIVDLIKCGTVMAGQDAYSKPYDMSLPHVGTALSINDNNGHSTTDQPLDLA